MIIAWKAKFSIDGAFIDADHRQIIRRINVIITLIRCRGDLEEILRVMRALYRLTNAHFFREEALLELSSCSCNQTHHMQHENVLKTLQGQIYLLEKLLNADEIVKSESLRSFKTFLYKWALGHIMADDRHIIDFVDDMRNPKSGLLTSDIDEIATYMDGLESPSAIAFSSRAV